MNATYEVHPAEEANEYVVVNAITGYTRCSCSTEAEALRLAAELNDECEESQ